MTPSPLSRYIATFSDSERLYLWTERVGLCIDSHATVEEAEQLAAQEIFPAIFGEMGTPFKGQI